jgi:hypothetical protein
MGRVRKLAFAEQLQSGRGYGSNDTRRNASTSALANQMISLWSFPPLTFLRHSGLSCVQSVCQGCPSNIKGKELSITPAGKVAAATIARYSVRSSIMWTSRAISSRLGAGQRAYTTGQSLTIRHTNHSSLWCTSVPRSNPAYGRDHRRRLSV